MKKSLAHTQVIVKLRKSVYREEWYLLLEAYPVFQDGSTTPLNVHVNMSTGQFQRPSGTKAESGK